MYGFFPFEEDLNHHIREALVTTSTGSAMSFYGNPFVKYWISALEPCHHPVYRKKLCRLIRCCIDVTGIEVCIVYVLSGSFFGNRLILIFPFYRLTVLYQKAISNITILLFAPRLIFGGSLYARSIMQPVLVA